MSVKFKSIQRQNLNNRNEPNKFYPVAVPTGKSDIDKLSQIISNSSTVSRTDVYAVIIGLLDAINSELSDGKIVYLGKLGSFSIALKGEGANVAGEVTNASIKRAKIVYRPGAEIKNNLKTLSYEKKQD